MVRASGIAAGAAGEARLRVRDRYMANLAAPPFIDGNRQRTGRQCPQCDLRRPRRNLVDLLADKLDRLLNLQPADVSTRENIAALFIPDMRMQGIIDKNVVCNDAMIPLAQLEPAVEKEVVVDLVI